MNGEPGEDGLGFRSEPLPIARAVLWGPIGTGPPQPLGQPYPVFLHQKPLRQLLAHTRSAPTKTLLGFLLGDVHECPDTGIRYPVIDQILRVEFEAPEGRISTSLALVWPRLQEKLRGDQQPRLIGWYHSHPTGGVALSPDDVGNHLMYFTQPWHAGLILGTEDEKPAAGWFRVAPGDAWPTIRLPFYEVLAPDSIDSAGKKRSFVDWANYKGYRAVLPPALAAAPRPAPAAPPPPEPAEEPAPSEAPAEEAAAEEAPAEEPPAEETPEEEPAPAPAPARRPAAAAPVRAPAAPRPRPRPPVEEEEEAPRPRAPVRPAPAPRARPVPPREERPTPAPQPRPAPQRQRWVAGALGAGAMGGLVVVGWLLGWVHFGAAPASRQSPATEATASSSPRVDPALVMLDQLTDSVLGSVRGYRERGTSFDNKQADCAALAQALVAVEGHWMAYNARGKPRDLVLDADRAARDRLLYAQMDSVETHFDRSACPRP